jgi:hypothetical protein
MNAAWDRVADNMAGVLALLALICLPIRPRRVQMAYVTSGFGTQVRGFSVCL